MKATLSFGDISAVVHKLLISRSRRLRGFLPSRLAFMLRISYYVLLRTTPTRHRLAPTQSGVSPAANIARRGGFERHWETST